MIKLLKTLCRALSIHSIFRFLNMEHEYLISEKYQKLLKTQYYEHTEKNIKAV